MTGPGGSAVRKPAQAFLAIFWAGMLAGVSFLATPVKFQAASLSLPVALEVGHVTFRMFSRIELALAVALVAIALPSPTSRVTAGCATLVAAIVAAQVFWLLPVLDARVEAVIAGAPLPPSPHHWLYATAEAAKLLLLCLVAAATLYRTVFWQPKTLRSKHEEAPGRP